MHGGTDDREIKWYTQLYLELKHFLEELFSRFMTTTTALCACAS